MFVRLLVGLAPLALAMWQSPIPPIHVFLPADFPVLGSGTLTIVISEEPISDYQQATKVRKPLLSALQGLPDLHQLELTLDLCYYAEGLAEDQKIVCAGKLPTGALVTVVLKFTAYRKGRGLGQCEESCETCTGVSIRCLKCAKGFFPVHTLPGPCTDSCDATCASCSRSSLWCTECADGYVPVASLPGFCSHCAASCETCSTFTTCLQCASGFFPNAQLPGTCTNQCYASCQKCSGSAAVCEECALGFFPETRLPGPCVQSCSSSCKQCHLSSLLCDVCNDGYSPAGELPSYCF